MTKVPCGAASNTSGVTASRAMASRELYEASNDRATPRALWNAASAIVTRRSRGPASFSRRSQPGGFMRFDRAIVRDAPREGCLAECGRTSLTNVVRSVRVAGRLAVGRLGTRSDSDLAWETELLQHLEREGLTVPVSILMTDGRLFADGLV